MPRQRIAGLVLLVIGAILFIVGVNASHSVADRWSNFFTGHFTDSTMWYMVVGIVAAIAGASLVLLGGRRATA